MVGKVIDVFTGPIGADGSVNIPLCQTVRTGFGDIYGEIILFSVFHAGIPRIGNRGGFFRFAQQHIPGFEQSLMPLPRAICQLHFKPGGSSQLHHCRRDHDKHTGIGDGGEAGRGAFHDIKRTLPLAPFTPIPEQRHHHGRILTG